MKMKDDLITSEEEEQKAVKLIEKYMDTFNEAPPTNGTRTRFRKSVMRLIIKSLEEGKPYSVNDLPEYEEDTNPNILY